MAEQVADPRAWWLSFGARVEGRQHLGAVTRQTLMASMQEATRQLEPWAVVPCVHLGLFDEARDLLFSGRWLAGALAVRGVYAVMSDYQVPLDDGSESSQLVHATLALSAHMLREHPDQLTPQLEGRLYGYRSESLIEQLLRNLPWFPFEPLSAVLTPPGGPLLCTLAGHTSRVDGALELRDGRLLSWSDDHTLRLWTVDGQPLQVLRGHTHVTGALELRDGRLLSWAGVPIDAPGDSTLRLWAADGHPLQVLKGHTQWVLGALELRDGRLLSWSYDGTLRQWSADGQPLQVLEGHTEPVWGALELRNGRLLSWSGGRTLRLWTADGQPLHVLEAPVTGALELRDGRLLSWSYHAKALRLWTADGRPLQVLEGHTEPVRGALELRDGRLLSWSDDHTLRLWTTDGESLLVLEGHTSRVNGGLELRDGRLLSWSDDHTLRLWTSDGESLLVLEEYTGQVTGALELRDGRLLSWSDDGTLRLWTAEGGQLQVLAGPVHGVHRVRGALELRDGRLLSWSYSWDETLRLWTAEGQPLQVLKGQHGHVDGALELPDGRLLSWSYNARTLCLWSAHGRLLATFHTDGPVTWCEVSAKGTIVAGTTTRQLVWLQLRPRQTPGSCPDTPLGSEGLLGSPAVRAETRRRSPGEWTTRRLRRIGSIFRGRE